MIYGKEVHTALEEYVRDGVELAKNYQQFKSMVDGLIAIKGEKLCEHEMALQETGNLVTFIVKIDTAEV